MAEAAPGSLAAAVDDASRLLATDPPEARRRAEAILKVAPTDPRAILILASARRRLGDAKGAHALLGPLAAAHPRAAHTQYELGLVLAALGEEGPATEALRRAVSLRPDLAEAWRALGDRLFLAGDIAGADRAFAEHARAAVREPALKGAADALFEGRLDLAERELRGRLATVADDAAAMQMLADVSTRLGRDGEAEILLARALQIDPDFDGARFDYANALFRRQDGAAAITQLEVLMTRDPAVPAYRNLLAACLGLIGEHGRALETYQSLLAEFPRQPKTWLNQGHALRTVGRGEDAMAAYRRCIALAPAMGDAYWSLANLKVARVSDEDIQAIETQLARPDIADEDRIHLNFALGKALEDQGAYEASFEHYQRGAHIRASQQPYNWNEAHRLVGRSKSVFTPTFFAERAGSGSPSEAPIFIVGLPRSGSTLVEQILASHTRVEGTMELPDIAFIAGGVIRAAGNDGIYPDLLAHLDGDALRGLGDLFIERTRVHRKLGRPFFVDKMPNNFQHIGLIQLILPNAKIIDARRHPMGAGFSAFKQHFARGHAFSYDLTDLGRYYRDYVELMAHFDEVLPGRVHRVIYEDMVEDTEGQVRALLDYCGLAFEESCLRFHENPRAVRTVSSEQVRRPIFREGVEQWRHYEPWLGPLVDALGPALEAWRGNSEPDITAAPPSIPSARVRRDS